MELGYRAVYELDFSSLRRPGIYQVHAGTAVSPPFRVASGQALYGPLEDNAVRYFTSERDGADVVAFGAGPRAGQSH